MFVPVAPHDPIGPGISPCLLNAGRDGAADLESACKALEIFGCARALCRSPHEERNLPGCRYFPSTPTATPGPKVAPGSQDRSPSPCQLRVRLTCRDR